MDQALTAERDDAGLRVAPRDQRLGPLLSTLHVEHLVAGADDRAVDETADQRRHLGRGHADHRLVEQRHPLDGPPRPTRACPCRARTAPGCRRRGSGLPTTPASAKRPAASSKRPLCSAWTASGRSTNPAAADSSSDLGEERRARASQPPAWASSPWFPSTKPIQNAKRTARSGSPASRARRCARAQASTLSRLCPLMNDAIASRPRSSSRAACSVVARPERLARPVPGPLRVPGSALLEEAAPSSSPRHHPVSVPAGTTSLATDAVAVRRGADEGAGGCARRGCRRAACARATTPAVRWRARRPR